MTHKRLTVLSACIGTCLKCALDQLTALLSKDRFYDQPEFEYI